MDLIVFFDAVDRALGDDCVSEDLVEVLARKNFILADVLQVLIRDAKLADVQVLLLVEPLDLDHWPVWLLR